MAKRIVSVALSNEVIDTVDKTSKALGLSRSEYIEMMLNKGFHFSEDLQEVVDDISRKQEKLKEKIEKRGIINVE